MMRTKINEGFTLLELLVVVSIIGIFSAVAISTLSDSRNKAKTGAFRAEIDTLIPTLVSVCHDRDIAASDLPGGTSYTAFASDPEDQSCGPSGDSSFSIEVEPTNGSACDHAILTEEGAIYTPSGC